MYVRNTTSQILIIWKLHLNVFSTVHLKFSYSKIYFNLKTHNSVVLKEQLKCIFVLIRLQFDCGVHFSMDDGAWGMRWGKERVSKLCQKLQKVEVSFLVFSFTESLSFFGEKVGEETLSNRVAWRQCDRLDMLSAIKLVRKKAWRCEKMLRLHLLWL